MEKFLNQFFKLKENKTSIKTEVIAGLTTFLAMAYILIVNPLILTSTGMDFGAVFTATALSAAIATIVMALVAKLPFALAPGMGLNAFFAYVVVGVMGYTWQQALAAILIEGVIFLILTFFNFREAIVNSIPLSLKKAVSVGIGLFIAFIGLQNGQIVVNSDATLVTLGSFANPVALVAIIGIIITSLLLVFKVRGALLIGILATTVVGIPFGVTNIDFSNASWLPPSLSSTFLQLDFSSIFTVDMLIVVFTFLIIDMFDTVGTLVGCATKAKILNSKGEIPRCKEALLADAVGTTLGALLGTSTVTTYVESSAGVAEGGKTGLTSLVVALLFLISLFLSPIFLIIPSAATTSALFLIGLFMMSPIKEIDFDDYTEAIPAFFTFLMMALTYSIANGIIFGLIAFVLLKVVSRKFKQIPTISYIIAGVFIIKLVIDSLA